MKPFDLYQHFHNFCEMLENEHLEIKTRIDMGKEWVRSLPARQLCVSYELSRDLIEKEMVGRLEDKEQEYGRGQGKASEAEKDLPGTFSIQQSSETGTEPVRPSTRNGGRTVTVEAVDRPKTPKAQRKGARKT